MATKFVPRAIADRLADAVGDALYRATDHGWHEWSQKASEALAAYHVFTKAATGKEVQP